MAKLIAKERFYYAGRNVEAGEEFEAENQDVAILTDSISPRASASGLHTAAIEPTPEAVAAPPPFQSHPAQPKRRRYQRRDMRAEE